MSDPSATPRQIKPHRSGGGAPFLNEAEDRQYAEWARAQDDDHLHHWETGSPMDRDALLKQIAAKRESQRRANATPPTASLSELLDAVEIAVEQKAPKSLAATRPATPTTDTEKK